MLQALGAAIAYGAGDFLGGIATRRAPLLRVLLWSQLIGLAGMAAVAATLSGAPPVDVRGPTLGGGAGVAGLVGVALLYRGLASGPASIVAPLAGAVGTALPVVVGLASGERASPAQGVGLVAAVVAVGLLSWPSSREVGSDGGSAVPAAGYGAGAGLALGVWAVLLGLAPEEAGLWPVVAGRGASVLVLLAGALAFRAVGGIPRSAVVPTLAAGVLDVSANGLYLSAAQSTQLSIAAPITNLYPATTVALAVLFLAERPTLARSTGFVLAVGAAYLLGT